MALPPITFLYGTHVPVCTHHIHKHFEGYYTIQYVAAGQVSLTIDGRPYALHGRTFFSCYPGPLIHFHVAPGVGAWDHRYLAFRGALVGQWAREGLFPVPPQAVPGEAGPAETRDGDGWAQRFDDLLHLALAAERWSQRRAVHRLEGILLDLAAMRDAAPAAAGLAADRPEPWLGRVLQELQAASEAEEAVVDYEALAGAVGMSVRTLRRRFQAAMGTTPHAYLLQQRIGAARKLLAETDMPIKTVASRLGYKDVFFFTRQFRAIAGVPPAEYRKSTQG